VATNTLRSGTRRRSGPQPYDFRRPSKFGRDHARAFQIVAETFSRQLGTVLSTTLRAVSVVAPAGIEQVSYDEYVRSLPNPSYLLVLALAPLPGASIFQIELPLALAAVERLVGGSGSVSTPNRPLTEIEEHLMRNLVERALRELQYSFESLQEIDARILRQESNAQFAQIAAPSDMSVVITWDVRIVEQPGRISLCIPFVSLENVLESLDSQSLFADRTGDTSGFATALAEASHQIPIELRVTFKPVMLTSGEVVALREGDVIPLGHRLTDPLALSVGDVTCYTGLSGRQGKRLACLVTGVEQDVVS
jgi:flagellar motor switch protein FliM